MIQSRTIGIGFAARLNWMLPARLWLPSYVVAGVLGAHALCVIGVALGGRYRGGTGAAE